MEEYAGGGTGLPAQPECGDAGSVLREALASEPPTGPLAEYEDREADRLEACVARDPADYIQESDALRGARPAIQCAFLAGLEKAIEKRRLASLPDLEGLFMHVIGPELDGPPPRSGNRLWDPPLRVCWLLDASFRRGAVGPELAESLERTILALAEAGERRGSSDCAQDEQDSLMGPFVGVGGLSFMLLFRYWLWREGARGAAGERFGAALREIVDGYIDGGAGRHTACRHSAIGMFAAAIHRRNPRWLRTIVERVERTREKVPFWAAYVASNALHRDAFGAMWKSYDRFLNGGLLYELGLDAVVDATFRHAALAYFYGLEHADGIFKRFVREARPTTIRRTVAPLALIMRGKAGDEAFDLEKAAGLWREERFAQLDLGIWFRHTPLDKGTAIELYRDYLGRYRGTIDMLAAPVDDLERYAKEFPGETAMCLLRMVEKSRLVDARAVGRIVGRLEEHGGREVDEACGAIREALAARGLYSEGDWGMPERRRAGHGARKGGPGAPGTRPPAGETDGAPPSKTPGPPAHGAADAPAGRETAPAPPRHPLYKSGEIPTMDALMYPVLEVCSDGAARSYGDLADGMSEWLGLPGEQLQKWTRGLTSPVIKSHSRWAAHHLYKAGLLAKEGRGRRTYFQITQKGKKMVADPSITELTTTYLKKNCPRYQK